MVGVEEPWVIYAVPSGLVRSKLGAEVFVE